jgi:hypothetical protein
LGGVAYDQSFQLEPVQIAGFTQTYRSIMPEAETGANAAPWNEIVGLALDQKLASRTYFGLTAEWLRSDVSRTFGVFRDTSTNVFNPIPYVVPSGTRQELEYEERSVNVSLSQLAGDNWSFGAVYRLAHASLDDRFPELTAVGNTATRHHTEGLLHQLRATALYHHPSGFFGQFDTIWSAQDNDGYTPARPGDDFWQFNVSAGWRFLQRRAEVRVGVLNLTDRDYRLNPLNLTQELPHERTFFTALRFSF